MKFESIDKFDREFWFLSNDHPNEVHLDGEKYPTVSHAYAAARTLDEEAREFIRKAATPEDARRISEDATARPAWEEVRLNILRDLVWRKFVMHPYLRSQLLATDDAKLTGGGEELQQILEDTRERIRRSGGGVDFLTKLCTDLDVVLSIMKRSGLPFEKRDIGGGPTIVIRDEGGREMVEIRFWKNDDLTDVVVVVGEDDDIAF